MTYVTQQGDMFDLIAYKTLGSEKYMTDVMKENPAYLLTEKFPAGVTLQIPDVETTETGDELPPWKRAVG